MHLSLFLLCLGVVVATAEEHFLSEDFINEINQKQNTWKAGQNFDPNTPRSHLKALNGVKGPPAPWPPLNKKKFVKTLSVPENFDAREQWPECRDIIGIIRDQSTCGSCWAVSAVSAMSDRICIASNGATKVSLSAENVLSCCGAGCGDGCNGGNPSQAWDYWYFSGIVSGGAYGSNEGCQTYKFPPCEHHMNGSLPACGPNQPTPGCSLQCDEGSSLVFKDDLHFGTDIYIIYADEDEVKEAIYRYGPVQTKFTVYEDFYNYKSGVYHHTLGEDMGDHAVKIIGWGVENEVPYWLVANTWNEEWGDKGYFKIRRGNNECRFENSIYLGRPR